MMRLDEDEKSREDQFKMMAIQPWRHGICKHRAGTRDRMERAERMRTTYPRLKWNNEDPRQDRGEKNRPAL